MARIQLHAPFLVALACTACSGKDAPASGQGAAATPAAAPAKSPFQPNDTVLDQQVSTLDGKSVELKSYRGKALLVVNTASQCGFTPQYAGLQKLYGSYRGKGLEVLAFPSDDFGHQEQGDAEEIRKFVDDKFQVEFTMFDKVHATGPEISPLYKTLSEQTGEGIRGEVKWNFTKFVVDPEGRVVARFEPDVEPDDPRVIAAIEAALPKGS
ncbi:MAG: glutathione peroxidase [Deltaproteobacteria bacterium]|nr:glutathione peroxidase [Deltaproteobacteria bacterium]